MNVWSAALMGSLAGVFGTGAGGLLSAVLEKPGRRTQAVLLSFTAGLMLAVVCFELLPEAFVAHSVAVGLAGLACGVAFVIVLDAALGRFSSIGGAARTGLLMAAGIAMHNFPEGLAIGSGYASAPMLGAGVCTLIALHDVPEGMAVGIPLRRAGASAAKAFAIAALSGTPTGLGALAGYAMGSVSPFMISLNMGIAGGAMLYLIASELMPQAGDLHRGRVSGVALCAGLALGVVAALTLG